MGQAKGGIGQIELKTRVIEGPDELRALKRGAVIVSPYWMDAFSYVGDSVNPWRLMNVATGWKTSPAEMGDFFPATVIFEFGGAS